jgi:hypothetical protein
MPSTYSNLKIQLMATGENNTTWGNVTNVNLGTALEEAIVGSADVAFSNANVTLTLTDTNATQSARNMRLNLTGTATAGYNLVVPAIEKPYIVNNGTDGTITVKNTTGTGIAVPAGKTMWVFNNGTNVVDVVTHLSSVTLGSALPVASGGTGATTFTSGRLLRGNGTSAVTASIVGDDGSTATVNGALITTGAASLRGNAELGATVTSGYGVSTGGVALELGGLRSGDGATFVDFHAAAGTDFEARVIRDPGVNGNFQLANTGTGSMLLTTVGAASMVFQTTSTERMRITSAGDVGIGNTPSGTYKLEVTGALFASSAVLGAALPVASGGTGQTTYTNGQLLIGNTTGNTLTKATLTAGTNISITNGAGAITINSTDQFVGTVTSVAASGGTTGLSFTGSPITTAGTLTLTGTLAVANGGTGLTSTPANGALDIGNGTGFTRATLTAGSGVSITNGAGSITIAATGSGGTVTSVNASGGATGMTFSGGPITGSGTLTLAGTLAIANGGTGTATAFTSGSVVFAGASGVYSQDNANLFWDDTNNRLGIGTTAPAQKLDIRGGDLQVSRGATGVAADAAINFGNSAANYIYSGNSSNIMAFATNGSERMRIDSSGNVGIGTSSPGYPLAVQANSGSGAIRLVGRSSDSASTLEFINSAQTTTQAYIQSGSTPYLAFATSTSERMRIDSAGNVGIGTTAPGAKLDVVGSGSVFVRARSSDTSGGAIGYVGAEIAGGGSLQIRAGIGYTYLVSTGATDPLLFGTNSTERIRITSGGNVGIGTSGPSYQTQITGLGQETAALTDAGNKGGSLYLQATAVGAGSGGAVLFGTTFGNATPFAAIKGFILDGATNTIGDLCFSTRNAVADTALTERLRILSTGGITSSNLADAFGYKGVPQNSQTATYTLALSDMGKHISITTGGVVIPANGAVAFPIGSTIVVYNNSASAQNISITTDTLRLAGTATTGTRSLAQRGLATCVKVAATEWVVTGNVT